MIGIDAALYKIKNAKGEPIEITFVRDTGKKIGSLKKVFVIYGSASPRDRKRSSSRSAHIKHKHSGKIPLVTMDGNPCTPFISHIVAVDGEYVKF